MHEMVKSPKVKPIYVRDIDTSVAVRRLAEVKGLSLTAAIRQAVEKELHESLKERPLLERIKHIQDRIAARPKTGLKADKAFYDSLYDD